MAEDKSNFTNTNQPKVNTFPKGLIKDYNDSYVPEGVWTNAINAVTNSHLGDMYTIGNEPSNLYCTQANFEVIGLIRLDATRWFVFSTNDITSEIGVFNESDCSYKIVVFNACLGFKKAHLISGATQINFDCSYTVFFADGNNPDRALKMDPDDPNFVNQDFTQPFKYIPYIIAGYDTTNPDCPVPYYDEPPRLDCQRLRLQYLITLPCYTLEKSNSPGTLFNGSYQVTIAYTIGGQRVTDYFSLSNVISIWSHENNGSSIDLKLSNLDQNFEEYEIVLISTVNERMAARRVGFYSTTQDLVHIDDNTDQLVSVPLEDIPINQAIYETSDNIYSLNYYLLRSGVKTKPEFNYQPLANQIVARWVQVQYPADYYVKGNNNTGYMRDEVYSFFIRWVYNTGLKTASYHIPGRPARTSGPNSDTLTITNTDVLPYDNNGSSSAPKWKVYNTASVAGSISGLLPDGGQLISTGYMSYWESTEKYPVKPSVWNSSSYSWSQVTIAPYPGSNAANYDLCGEPIRHHKFPDDTIAPIYNSVNNTIQLLGVRFENIKPPLDQAGNLIGDIVGYEILRGSREGNKSIIAKGLIYNMWKYNDPFVPNINVLYQNYPFNCLQPDYFLRTGSWYTPAKSTDHDDAKSPATVYQKDYFSIHSPDLMMRGVYLNPSEIKIYKEYTGKSTGSFVQPYGHPKQKIPTYGAFIGSMLLGLGLTLQQFTGKKTTVNGNVADPTTLTTNTSVGAVGLAGGVAASAGAIATGSTAWTGGTYIGIANGAWTGLSLPQIHSEDSGISSLNPTAKKGNIVAQLLSYIQQVTLIATTGAYFLAQNFGNIYKAFKELMPWVQYARQYNGVGLYNGSKNATIGNIRREVVKARYISNSTQQFDSSNVVNNINRQKTVVLNTKGTINDPTTTDKSRVTIHQEKIHSTPNKTLIKPISAHYAGLKINNPSQYSQLSSVSQVPIGTCVQPKPNSKATGVTSQVYFGGDVYVNRYTELNKFSYFTNWLYDQPDGTDFDYKSYANIPYPRYWANFSDFDLNDVKLLPGWPSLAGGGLNALIKSIGKLITTFGLFIVNPAQAIVNLIAGPNQFFHLDRDPSVYAISIKNILKFNFYVKNGYFYLFNNGVKDFYCESEINLACRDYGEQLSEQFYNPYGFSDISTLFRTDLMTVPEFFKYDFSMSSGRLASSYVSWGYMLPNTYDPDNQACFEYFPNRMIYSLQQQYEQSRDNWRIYLANNYKDFENQITNVKSLNRTGALILFQDAIPTTINGVDELRTSAGNRITIGDAGLFNQSFQNLVNADLELEYGSCQSQRSVINTPYGVFWISQRNGKIMHLFNNQITDISMNGMRFWFAENLRYHLLKEFPNFPHTDNPVKGVGCQSVYDNQYEIVYFMKKDFKKKDADAQIVYNEEYDVFTIAGYSSKIGTTYGAGSNSQLKTGYSVQGTFNKKLITNIPYKKGSEQQFVKALVAEIEGAPNVKRVFYNLQAYQFSIDVDYVDPSIEPEIDLEVVATGGGISALPSVTADTKTVSLNDPEYFEDCSWTVSYDPKTKLWVSFHDWHPDLTIMSNEHFYTIYNKGFWKHNAVCNSYNNYYNRNYGWEVEFPVNTQTTVTTIKSVEYYLEVFKYNVNCSDRYHVLDGNFDQAVLYNTEQTSGILNLNVKPKSNPAAMLLYPKVNVNLDSIDILVAKEENKYRFNQFWDVTRNRGEFDGKQITNFITECNGYRVNVNPGAVNYLKSPLERKKFRHYGNRVILRRLKSGDEKMNLKTVVTKETLSPR